MGPQSWSGAKHALEAVAENIIFPTRTRIVKHEVTGGSVWVKLLLLALVVLLLAYLWVM